MATLLSAAQRLEAMRIGEGCKTLGKGGEGGVADAAKQTRFQLRRFNGLSGTYSCGSPSEVAGKFLEAIGPTAC